jgi:heptaprenyl diphosphate synthase
VHGRAICHWYILYMVGDTSHNRIYQKGSIIIKQETALKPVFPAKLIENRLRQVASTGNPRVDSIINYLLAGSGKMLRPRLVYHTAALSEHDDIVVRDIAVAVELIHLASLVHDDIIDNSLLRRGRESLNAHSGNSASVLAGDFLFASAFQLINRHRQSLVMEDITRTIKVMCSGEIIQMGLAYDVNVGLDEYYDRIYRKTACLFASSCKIGALVSQAESQQIKKLEQFGLCLGYAYQIIDDVMDLVADSALLGKPVGNDLTQGNITLPLILAMKNEQHGPRVRDLLEQRSSIAASLGEIINLVIVSGCIGEAIEHAAAFLERGLEHLQEIPPGDSLEELKCTCLSFIETYRPVLERYHPLMERQA